MYGTPHVSRGQRPYCTVALEAQRVSVLRYQFFKCALGCDPFRYHSALGNIKISFACDIILCSLKMPSPETLVSMYPTRRCLAQKTVGLKSFIVILPTEN
jgi:hypothetical protein